MNCFLYRKKKAFRSIVGVLIYCTVVFPVFGSTGWSAPAPAGETARLSAREKQNLVQQGVDRYKQGKHDLAQKDLELAETVLPENYAVPYYLGLIYLEQGKRTAAIAQWQQYVKMDSQSDNALRIRKNLTLLLRQEALESARMAVANEAALLRFPAADNTVAISTFKNMGSENIGPLGKGMAALLIQDLSQVPDLQVVERVKLQALLQEMKLGTSGLVAPETAPRVGKLLKARHVTSGSLADLEKDNLQIASVVMDADRMAGIGTQEARGALKQFYALEKEIACQIIEDLGRDCGKVPAAFHTIHTQSLAALIFFGAGLDYLDKERYEPARVSFQKALEQDPSFDLAQRALLDTPVPGMQFTAKPAGAAMAGGTGIGTTEQMIAMAATHGVSADAAGTALAADSTLSAGATGGVGIVPIAGLVGGAALVAGAAAAAGGGSDGSGGSAVTPTAQCNEQQVSGGDAGDLRTIDMGKSSGNFTLYYETQNIPDQIIIRQGGIEICNTDCVSTGVGVQFQEMCTLNGRSTTVDVQVVPNCDGNTSGTWWTYTVNCP